MSASIYCDCCRKEISNDGPIDRSVTFERMLPIGNGMTRLLKLKVFVDEDLCIDCIKTTVAGAPGTRLLPIGGRR